MTTPEVVEGAVLSLDTRRGARVTIKRRSASTYWVSDAYGFLSVSVRRKRGESLAAMIIRLADKALNEERRPMKMRKDARIAKLLGIYLD